MKTILLTGLALLAGMAQAADTYTQGYVRRDGSYVQGHYSTSPNNTRVDNYSTQGNVNPYTGRAGTVNPYGASTYQSNPYGVQPLSPTPRTMPIDPYGLNQPGNKRF